MTRSVNSDLIAGSIGLAASAVFWFSIEEDVMAISIMFPRAMALIMAAVSVGLLVKAFVRPSLKVLFAEGDNRRVVVTGLALFGWGVAMNYIGFFVSSVLAITFISYYLALARRRVSLGRLAVWLVIAVAEVGFFYLIFTELLHVPLPEGLFL